jgi:hypothetical protein
MSNKIVSPFTGIFAEPPNALRIWLGQNKNSFDNFEDTHKDTRLSVKTRIHFTSTALQDPLVAE